VLAAGNFASGPANALETDPAPAPASAPQEATTASTERFAILEFRVLGNSVLPTVDIERAVYRHLGSDRTLEDVQNARAALEQAYRGAGYSTVFVDIPEQQVDEGIVRLRVTEGRLDRVHVTGARYFANRKILATVPSLTPGVVPQFPQLQRELAEVNGYSADLRVTPVLKAGRTPGTVDAELKANDTLPLHGSIEADNRYTAGTTQSRVGVGLSYDNLFQRRQSLSLQFQTAPEQPEDTKVFAGTYVLHWPGSENMLALYAVKTDSDVATIGTLSVLGKGRIFGSRAIFPLPAGDGYFHSFTLGLDYKDFLEDVRLTTDTGLTTPINYLHWSAVYAGSERRDRWSLDGNVGVGFGVSRAGNDALEFENKRFKARPNYFYLRSEVSASHALPAGWSVFAHVAGQFTAAPLVSNEQFSIGGAGSVRGYLESQELGDYGFSSSVELRTPRLLPALAHLNSFYLLGFYDTGLVSVLDPLKDQRSRADLSSWGVGMRFAGVGGLEATFDWAYPLAAANHVDAGNSRINFYLKYGF
jgi:hemolysin activation/secretion protein